MQIRVTLFLLLFSFSISGCKNETKSVLTEQEKRVLDSLGFDKEIVNDVKLKINQPFSVMASENKTGMEIHMLPVMLYFKVEKSLNTDFIEDIKAKNNSKRGYNVYSVDQNDGKLTIIISKL